MNGDLTAALVPLMDSTKRLHTKQHCNECQTLKRFSCLEDEGQMKMSEAKMKSLFSTSATTKKTAPFVQSGALIKSKKPNADILLV